ncbi:MAG: hypothetical protein U0X91_27765 [Spirosomataceae bacterium]
MSVSSEGIFFLLFTLAVTLLIAVVLPKRLLLSDSLSRNVYSFLLIPLRFLSGSFRPVIKHFEIVAKDNAVILPNDIFEIEWVVKGAYRVTLSEIGNVTGLKSYALTADFEGSKEYLLTACGISGLTSRNLTVRLYHPAFVVKEVQGNHSDLKLHVADLSHSLPSPKELVRDAAAHRVPNTKTQLRERNAGVENCKAIIGDFTPGDFLPEIVY